MEPRQASAAYQGTQAGICGTPGQRNGAHVGTAIQERQCEPEKRSNNHSADGSQPGWHIHTASRGNDSWMWQPRLRCKLHPAGCDRRCSSLIGLTLGPSFPSRFRVIPAVQILCLHPGSMSWVVSSTVKGLASWYVSAAAGGPTSDPRCFGLLPVMDHWQCGLCGLGLALASGRPHFPFLAL